VAEVAFKDVDKVYPNGVKAVDGLTLEARDGEFLVLVGPSGCGKTTALRMVAGLEDISAGTLSIGNRVVNDMTPKERDVAMVFQNYALYPHLSVGDNIAFGLRLRKTPKSVVDERVAWAAKMLDLTPYLARRPKELSGGQRQRVAMGRAIVRHPQAFLMDEPLSNLDAKLRVQMRADIARLQHDLGTTTIYVTHDQIEAVTMGHRVAVMSQGLLQQVDTPMRLFDVPANLFVAAFIGTPPMNLLEGDVHASNGKVALQVGGQRLELADKTLARYPQVKAYDGRKAVMGVRPDDLHAAATRPDLPVMTARLDLLEALGTHSVAYFKVEAEAFSGSAIVEEEEQETTGEGVTGSRPNLVASVPSREALELKIGDQVPLGVDVATAHLFDPETGAPLR
jgi:multiple sugar transport system ATP-binding protein